MKKEIKELLQYCLDVHGDSIPTDMVLEGAGGDSGCDIDKEYSSAERNIKDVRLAIKRTDTEEPRDVEDTLSTVGSVVDDLESTIEVLRDTANRYENLYHCFMECYSSLHGSIETMAADAETMIQKEERFQALPTRVRDLLKNREEVFGEE